MIQRIQTIYLFIAVLLSFVVPFFVSFWTNELGAVVTFKSLLYGNDIMLNAIAGLFLFSGLLTLIAVFLFKTRKNQILLNRIAIFFNLIILGLFIYQLLIIPGGVQTSEKGIGLLLPLLVIVLLAIANMAIKKDENLVKSVDRLR